MLNEKIYRILDSKIDLLKVKDKDAEERKVLDEVFDHRTLLTIYKLICDGTISTIDYPISTGKEGNVFKGSGKEGAVAVKIYRISNATFNTISKYIVGDPRFKGVKRSRGSLIFAWSRKEFANLSKLHEVGVNVPKPITQKNNVLVMSYVGDDSGPAPLLRNVALAEPEETFNDIVSMITLAYRKAGLVHTDLSEYNILFWEGRAVLIDLGQGTSVHHPNALEFLRRDLTNLVRYFRRLGVESDVESLMRQITEAD